VEQGYLDIVQALLAVPSIDVNAYSYRYGAPPLCEAIEKGHMAIIEALLVAYADVNAPAWGGQFPLHLAIEKGYLGIVEALIAACADVNAKNINGWTPLHLAVAYVLPKVVQVLLAADADVSAKGIGGRTALHLAALNGHLDVVEMLLAVPGIEVNVRDDYGQTALDSALECLGGVAQVYEAEYQAVIDLLRGRGGKTGDEIAKEHSFGHKVAGIANWLREVFFRAR
jgi:ankyrin repeat protein